MNWIRNRPRCRTNTTAYISRSHIPYLSQPRCNLEALSFADSFTNVDGERLDNNEVRLAWKVHEPTDKHKTYDSLEILQHAQKPTFTIRVIRQLFEIVHNTIPKE